MDSNKILTDIQIDISFCLPVYNVGRWLEACLKSILSISQITYEIICVDDCSTDDSLKILEKYEKTYDNFIVVKNKINKGVGYSRNVAMDIASGKYLWFVDPDDLINPYMVENVFTLAEEKDADIVLGDYQRFSENDTVVFCKESKFEIIEANDLILPRDNNGKSMCAVWAGIFRRLFLKENSLRFNERMIAQEDTLLYFEIGQKYPSVLKICSVVYYYRMRLSSVMHSHSEERLQKYCLSMVEMLKVYQDYYDKNEVRDYAVLLHKINHSKENIMYCLTGCIDRSFFNNTFNLVKKMGWYPYPFRKDVLNYKMNIIQKMLIFLLPVKPIMMLTHIIFSTYNKNRYKKTHNDKV